MLLVSGLPKSGSGVESKCKKVKKWTVVRVNLEVERKKARWWGGALVGLVKRKKAWISKKLGRRIEIEARLKYKKG